MFKCIEPAYRFDSLILLCHAQQKIVNSKSDHIFSKYTTLFDGAIQLHPVVHFVE